MDCPHCHERLPPESRGIGDAEIVAALKSLDLCRDDRKALGASLGAVKAERDAAIANMEAAYDQRDQERVRSANWQASHDVEVQRRKRMEAALRKYGRHTVNCLKGIGKGNCYEGSCGLDAALADAEGDHER